MSSRLSYPRAVPLLLVLVLASPLAATAAAQITAATISGTVTDETGGVLPGVDIEVKNLGTGASRTVVTDASGVYTASGLPPGKYEVRATLPGFQTEVRAFTLAVGQEAGLSFGMKVGTTSEDITVVATAVLVDTRNAALSAVVTEETIEQLPLNGRNYIDLALLQPGVTQFSENSSTASSNRGKSININGMGRRSNSYLLDGANMRGYAGTSTVSAAETTLGVETIQEFRVVTNSYSADYGRAMGGVISLVSKSGTNSVHGSAFEFYRDSAMDARNFFDLEDPPEFTRNQFGGTVGGPIVQSRVFYFGGYERLQEDLGTTEITRTLNAGARSGAVGPINPTVRPYLDLYPLPNAADVAPGIGEYIYEANRATRENFVQGRVDYMLSEQDTFFARYTYDGADQGLPVGFPAYSTSSISRNQFFTSEYKRIITPALLNTARFSHSRLRFEQLPVIPTTPELAFIDGQDVIGNIGITGVTTLGASNTNPSTNNNYYWTFSNDLSYSKGRHLMKVGVLFEHVRSNKLVGTATRGTHTFPSVVRFLAGTPTRFTGVAPGAQLERVRPNDLYGFYVQDDFRMNDRLTLNLGLRYEFWTLPADKFGYDTTLRDIFTDTAFTVGPPFGNNPSLKNFAPRLGFAWDVNGDGRTAVRGGAGVYHDTDGTYNSAFGIAAFSPPFASQETLTNPAFPRPTLGTGTVALSARTLDYNVKQPYAMTYNVSVQREIVGEMVMTVGYAGSRGNNLVSAIEANPYLPQILPDGTMFFPSQATNQRRNPAWGPIDYRTNGGESKYNALQTSVQKRFSRGYQVQATYTLAKATDNTQAQLGADADNSSVFPQNPYDRDADWARTDFDVRHVFTSNFLWELPGQADHPLAGGWQLNGILTFRTGVPFTVQIGEDWSRSDAGSDRPNVKPGVDPGDLRIGDPNRFFDTSAFELQPQGFFGNAGRNSLEGPRYVNVNLALVKNTRLAWLGGGGQLQFRFEVFNLLNHANFATPTRTVFEGLAANEEPLATAGRVTRTVTTARQLQLGVKVLF
jgi:hypothetical protein